MLGLVDLFHLGKFGKLLQRFADNAAFHIPDRDVHPGQRADDQQEKQHEAAGPQAGQVNQCTKRDRKHEAAKTADHSHQSADGADILGIVDRDVLVDRSFAQRHEEAEHEHRYRERDQPHLQVEADRAVDSLHK